MSAKTIAGDSDVFVSGEAAEKHREEWKMLNCTVDPPSGIASSADVELVRAVVTFYQQEKTDKGKHLLSVLDEYPRYGTAIKERLLNANKRISDTEAFREAAAHVVETPHPTGGEGSFAAQVQDMQAAFNFLRESGGFRREVADIFAQQFPEEAEKLQKATEAGFFALVQSSKHMLTQSSFHSHT